ncbi:uncharacterized protein LOC126619502 isoform X2 [Malus sylvestris]|uniref:uncharacterized protein LOC126619502 isoform X2 n=1 Tax=Malus sylvestris TaxID=3752 RepID=UPI000498721C|nr:uncharacterized protein LOC126619502 isoform X2 [Malus sylvestris]
METNGSNSNSQENQPLDASNIASRGKLNEKEVFVNNAEIAWHEKRREWIGNQSQKSRRAPKEPIMRAFAPSGTSRKIQMIIMEL